MPLGLLTPNSSKRDVVAAIIHEAHRRGYSPYQTTAIIADTLQESNANPRAEARMGCGKARFSRTHRIRGAATRTWPSRSSSTGSTITAARAHPTSGSPSSGCNNAPATHLRRRRWPTEGPDISRDQSKQAAAQELYREIVGSPRGGAVVV